jgi:hypothetical protein
VTATFGFNVSSSFADARTPFAQDRDLVRNIFADDNTRISDSNNIEYFPAKKGEQVIPEEVAMVEPATPESAQKPKEAVDDVPTQERVAPQTAAELIAKFGDPTKRKPVLAKGDSPEAFQGLQAALELGDEELAFQFARQYIRYMKEIQERGHKISQLMKQANLAEKLSDDDKTENVTVKEVKEYEEYLAMQESGLGPEARAMLANAEKFENLQSTDRIERDKAKKALKALLARGEIPVDPKGAVNVFFFIDINGETALQTAGNIEQLYRRSLQDSGLNVGVLTLDDAVSSEGLREFREKSGVSFPIQAGARLAGPLGVTTAPTSVFSTQTTSKTVIRPGVLSPIFVDELVNVMQSKGI